MINQRVFNGTIGNPSTGIGGPDAIETDIDNLLANDQELLGITGDKDDLTTTAKTNLVAAINEHETQINNLAAEVDDNKAAINSMTVKQITVPKSSSVTVAFDKDGHFYIQARVVLSAGIVGAYVAHTYTLSADRWKVATLAAATDLTIATGTNSLTLTNANANEAIHAIIVSFNGAKITTS